MDAQTPWNHNVAYHPIATGFADSPCGRALDVGCGQRLLLAELAERCGEVIGIDPDDTALAPAATRLATYRNVTPVKGNVMSTGLGEDDFDLVTAVASLHYMPLRPALARLAELVRPGGSLVVIGLYRATTPMDYGTSVLAAPVAAVLRHRRGHAAVGAPTMDPTTSLSDIRRAAAGLLPGARIRRLLLFRYELTWTRPAA